MTYWELTVVISTNAAFRLRAENLGSRNNFLEIWRENWPSRAASSMAYQIETGDFPKGR